jgi:hypothetical protein
MRLAAVPGLGVLMTRIPPTRRAVRIILKQLGLGPALANGKISDEFIEWFLAALGHTDTMINELRANPKVITPIGGVNDRMLLQPELLERVVAPEQFIWARTTRWEARQLPRSSLRSSATLNSGCFRQPAMRCGLTNPSCARGWRQSSSPPIGRADQFDRSFHNSRPASMRLIVVSRTAIRAHFF